MRRSWERPIIIMLSFGILTTTFTTRTTFVKGFTAFRNTRPIVYAFAAAVPNNIQGGNLPLSDHHRSFITTTTTTTLAMSSERQTHTRDFQGKKGENDKDSLGLGQKSWRSLIEVSMARSRKIRGSNYVQLATVDPVTNEPRCRTVVFRGFQTAPPTDTDSSNASSAMCDDLSCIMKMCTDQRSRKVMEAASAENHVEVGEIVWWFSKSSEQYRMRGKLVFVGGGNFSLDQEPFWKSARKELWGNLSDAARESFLDPHTPGQPLAQNSKGEVEVPPGGRDAETGKPVPPPDNFLLMLLFPHNVDYLNLKENYRQIDEQDDTKSWSFQQVNA